MLTFLKKLSQQRSTWFLLFLSGFLLESTALYFQYVMALKPCVMCIYERVALLGILLASLITLVSPHHLFWRLIGILLGLGCALKGLQIALIHWDFQHYPAPWKQCSLTPDFPAFLPLDQWLPFMFKPLGWCGANEWQLWGLGMVDWILAVFIGYALLFFLLLISQFKRTKPQRRLFH